MQGPEKVVCCSLCLCLAVAVLSSVSLVYLTFIVYLPAKKEMESGLLEIPVICTTVEMLETDHCKKAGYQIIAYHVYLQVSGLLVLSGACPSQTTVFSYGQLSGRMGQS